MRRRRRASAVLSPRARASRRRPSTRCSRGGSGLSRAERHPETPPGRLTPKSTWLTLASGTRVGRKSEAARALLVGGERELSAVGNPVTVSVPSTWNSTSATASMSAGLPRQASRSLGLDVAASNHNVGGRAAPDSRGGTSVEVDAGEEEQTHRAARTHPRRRRARANARPASRATYSTLDDSRPHWCADLAARPASGYRGRATPPLDEESLEMTEPWVSVEDVAAHLGVAKDSV